MKRKIKDMDLDGFDLLDAMIRHKNGGTITYQGLARDPQAIKSVDDAELAWVEEAQSLSEDSLEELTPSIRGKEAELWFTANLKSSLDPFSQRFFVPFEKELRAKGYYEDELHTIVWINYYDNPWFPEHLEMERKSDKERLTRAAYDHKWLGEPSDQVEGSIILPEWFDAAVDAHLQLGFKPRGQQITSHDPSDSGDPRALVIRHGSVVTHCEENEVDDVNDACDWALDHAIQQGSDVFTWDCDGLGLTLKRQVSQSLSGKKIEAQLFKGSEGVHKPDQIYEPDDLLERKKQKTNKETFKNKRSQFYWYLRDRFYRTYLAIEKGEYIDPDSLISISSDIKLRDKMKSEVCRIPLKPNGNGLIQIMSKREMKDKHDIDSPNLADSLMMSMFVPDVSAKPQKKPIDIPTVGRKF